MAENSKIEWTDHTFNCWRGCTKVSDGCAHCYAATMSGRNPKTLGVWGQNGRRVVAAEAYWRQPLKWDSEAKAAGERRRVFCASLADVFEDWPGRVCDVNDRELWTNVSIGVWEVDAGAYGFAFRRHWTTLDEVRARLFRLIDETPNLDWLLLTKRPENIAKMMPPCILNRNADGQGHDETGIRENLWLGVSVENQQTADERIPLLLQAPAAVRFLSCEPLLGPVDLPFTALAKHGEIQRTGETFRGLHWVIVGGESGHGARPMHPGWAQSLRFQCQSAGVAFFFKQWGEWVPGSQTKLPDDDLVDCLCTKVETPALHVKTKAGPITHVTYSFKVGKKAAGRLLDGREWNEFPRTEVAAS